MVCSDRRQFSRRYWLLALLVLLLIAAALAVWGWGEWSRKMRVTWKPGGANGSVSGRVIDLRGRPVKGATVIVSSASGNETTTTDAKGEFAVQLGEDLTEFGVQGYDTIKWPMWWGVSTAGGIRAEVRLKAELPDQSGKTVDPPSGVGANQ